MRDRFVHIGRLTAAAKNRKPGVIEAYNKVGKAVVIRGQPFLQLSDADYQAIRAQFALVKPASTVIIPAKMSTPPPGFRLGDAIHKVAGPVGRAIKWPCMKGDGTINLKAGSPCDRARKLLNKL